MNFRCLEPATGVSRAGVGSDCQDRERQGVATEAPWMGSRRVLAVTTHPGSPPITQSGSSGLAPIIKPGRRNMHCSWQVVLEIDWPGWSGGNLTDKIHPPEADLIEI